MMGFRSDPQRKHTARSGKFAGRRQGRIFLPDMAVSVHAAFRCALILGARSDIGRAIARRLAQQGVFVHLAARHAERLDADVQDLAIRYGAQAAAWEFDALDFGSHEVFCQRLNPAPDLVICVFGYLGDPEAAEQDPAEAQRIVATNYTGAVSILMQAAKLLKAQGQGCIVGISSVAGDRGRGSNYLYGSAKAGFSAFLSGLRNRLFAVGVHVITVKPGFVRTAMTDGLPLPAPLTAAPEEVAEALWRALRKSRNVIYVRPVWRYIMLIIKLIPEPLFKRLSL